MRAACVAGAMVGQRGAGMHNRPAARVGVGGVRSSAEAANPRGAKGPHLVEVNSEAEDW